MSDGPKRHRRHGLMRLLWSEHHLVLSFKILCFYLVHGVITEDIVLEMKSAGLSLGYFFSFLSATAAMLLSIANIWSTVNLDICRKMSFQHVQAGISSFGAQALAGQAIVLLRFNTVQLFKSSKVGFVMFLSYFFLDAPLTKVSVTLALVMSFGLFVISNADIKSVSSDESDSIVGFLYISTGLFLSGYSSVVQQASLQNVKLQSALRKFTKRRRGQRMAPEKKLSKEERKALKNNLLLFSNLLISSLLFCVCLFSGELVKGVLFFRNAPKRLALQQLLALFLSAYGQQMVLTFNQRYGAVLCSIVLTIRKVATFVTSVLLFPKPFNFGHVFGLTSVSLSTLLLQAHLLRLRNKQDKKIKTDVSDGGFGQIV